MLAKKLAATEKTARVIADNATCSDSTIGCTNTSANQTLLNYYGEYDTGVSVVPSKYCRRQTEYLVKWTL